MQPFIIVLIIIGILLLSLFLFFLLPLSIIALHVYKKQLTRKNKDMWGRKCSAPDNKEQVMMYEIGEEWFNENKDFATDVSITSYDGLHLVGQYFDFGFNKCAIIHQGRTESLIYSHYFAKPYKELGFNILVVDPRAHGLSDGKYSTVGVKESKDLLKWIELMHDKYNNEKIFLHGICIGSATCLYAITDKNTKDYIEGLVVDGMYKDFYSTMKTHSKVEGAPFASLISYLTLLWMAIIAKANAIRKTPKKAILKLKKPILMIHSEMDIFSLPVYATMLYDSCKADKKIVWFKKGAHSHIRINNQEEYDNAIKEFIKERNL